MKTKTEEKDVKDIRQELLTLFEGRAVSEAKGILNAFLEDIDSMVIVHCSPSEHK